MPALAQDPVFSMYVGALIVLVMNMLVLANNTALSRAGAKEVVNPEDVVLNAGAAVVYYAANARTERYRRAHRNALENIPPFLLSGLLLPILGVPPLTAGLLLGIFVAARIFHSVAYMAGWQPWRTIGFFVGALDQIAMLGFIGWYAFAAA